MGSIFTVGTQWGDEGKGKVANVHARQVHMGVRCNGGNNAGHTFNDDGEERVLHLIPATVMNEEADCIIEKGVVIDVEGLLVEIDMLEAGGVSLQKLGISPLAHLVMPWHSIMDKGNESTLAKDGQQIGTTGKGIGPCYQDKAGRKEAFRVGDLRNFPAFLEKLERIYVAREKLFRFLFGESRMIALEEARRMFQIGRERILPYVCDTSLKIQHALDEELEILVELSQGTLLDPDHGTFPFNTSSGTTAIAASHITGIPIAGARVVGVVKAYPTRVGEGPFPTEMDPETDTFLRNYAGEFGATTGRKRRCGWPDIPIIEYAKRVNRLTEIALTRLDTIGILETIKICERYRGIGTIGDNEIYDIGVMEPEYTKEIGGWSFPPEVRHREDLPKSAQKFIRLFEDTLRIKVTLVSTGAKRKDIITY